MMTPQPNMEMHEHIPNNLFFTGFSNGKPRDAASYSQFDSWQEIATSLRNMTDPIAFFP